MQIILVREKQTAQNAIQQVNNRLIDRIQTAYKALGSGYSESLILPVVPKTVQFPKVADVENYKGISESFNIPSYKNLEDITIQSIFPVFKDYTFANKLANLNGWDYVEFLQERQDNQLPLRLIAFDFKGLVSMSSNILANSNNMQALLNNSFRPYADFLCVVKDFKYNVDNVKDINYTLTLSQFNSDMANYSIDWEQLKQLGGKNITSRYTLKALGLI